MTKGPQKIKIHLSNSADITEVERLFEASLLQALQLRQKNLKLKIKKVDKPSKEVA